MGEGGLRLRLFVVGHGFVCCGWLLAMDYISDGLGRRWLEEFLVCTRKGTMDKELWTMPISKEEEKGFFKVHDTMGTTI
ncbi:hypothetical protein SLE2022_156750 [Rubroshorea leprosula]